MSLAASRIHPAKPLRGHDGFCISLLDGWPRMAPLA
jgi:hypothetical protein